MGADVQSILFFLDGGPDVVAASSLWFGLVGFTIGSDLFGLESIPPGAFFGLQPFGLGDLRIAREFNGLCRFDMISVDLARSSEKT